MVFPFLLVILLLILTTLRISGTSESIYYPILYGQHYHDSNLLYGNPSGIRSDEWLVNTQLTIAQSAAGYPEVNPNIDHGQNMSVIGDAPYKDWSSIFKIQNLAFFILPLAYAFAFKWWLLLFLTIVSCYFLVLRFIPGKRFFATIISLAISCSPFLFWWYGTGTFAPIFYGFFIIILAMRIINGERVRFLSKLGYSYTVAAYIIALSYLLVAFALILYPPFQIPIAIAILLFTTGYLLDKQNGLSNLLTKSVLKKVLLFGVSIVIALGVVVAFVHTRANVISAIEGSVYPGKRIIEAGGASTQYLFSSFLQPQLQHPFRAIYYFTNQSEASNFLLFLPFLFIPGCALLVYEYINSRRLNWSLLALQFCGLLFLANMYIPALQPIYKITFLDNVPHARLVIGLGFVGFIQLILIIKSLSSPAVSKLKLEFLVTWYCVLCFGVLLEAGLDTHLAYPKFIDNFLYILILALLFITILFCFLSKKYLLGALIFLLFSLGSVFQVQPLYRGLGPLYNSKITRAIDSVSTHKDTWAELDNIDFENFAALSNRKSLSGVQLYPNVKLWSKVAGAKDSYIYNRYAHITFNSNSSLAAPMVLIQNDYFYVRFTCNNFIEKNINYVLATHLLSDNCISLIDQVKYPAVTFYIYRMQDY